MTARLAWQVRPARTALDWAASAVGPGAGVRSVHRLGAGIAQATHALTIDSARGRRHRLVLQVWSRPGWQEDDPGFDPAKEAAVLDALAGGAVPIPRVVAVDPDGSLAGAPALLTERLAGRPPSVAAIRRPGLVNLLGTTLADIHRLGRARWTPSLAAVVPPYYPFGRLGDASIPAATRRHDLWMAAMKLAAEAPSEEALPTLIHRDYHAWNTLWSGDRLTGVVDWSSASWGPPAADLAHLRVDLAFDVSVESAVLARTAFAGAGGDLTDARYHQVRTVFDYLSDSQPDLYEAGAIARLDEFLAIVLDELDASGG